MLKQNPSKEARHKGFKASSPTRNQSTDAVYGPRVAGALAHVAPGQKSWERRGCREPALVDQKAADQTSGMYLRQQLSSK